MQRLASGHHRAAAAPTSVVARAPAAAGSRPRVAVVRAAVEAKPASLTVKSADGADVGTEQLALKIARPEAAKGLVHRYVVYVMQNKRRVSGTGVGDPFMPTHQQPGWLAPGRRRPR
jgi:hypothetical protein